MSSQSNTLPLSTVAVGVLLLAFVASLAAGLTNDDHGMSRQQAQTIPFSVSGFKRGDHVVLYVTGTEEQIRKVARENPDADVIGVHPTDKSVYEVQTELADSIEQELHDTADMFRAVRQR